MSHSEISRAYARVQQIIFQYLSMGYNPTSEEIQRAYYGEDFDLDSTLQSSIIYGCITRGREIAIKRLDLDINSDKFSSETEWIKTYEAELCKREKEKEEYKEFWIEIKKGRFGKEARRESEEVLEEMPSFAIYFKRKTLQYAKEGACLITPSMDTPFTRGTKRWFIPSWFRWNIREIDQYKKTLKAFRTQLKRGITTKVALPSGVSLKKALAIETVTRASLIDKTVWTCPKCSAPNLDSSEVCGICGTKKSEED